MTEFEGVLGYQVRTMLDGIALDVKTRRQTMLDTAQQRARELLAQTRRQARQRVHQAVSEERQLLAKNLDKTRAALASRQRRRQQALDVERLERGRALLGEALRIRWENPETRADWVRAVIDDAKVILQPGNWHVQYPEGIDEAWITGLIADQMSGSGQRSDRQQHHPGGAGHQGRPAHTAWRRLSGDDDRGIDGPRGRTLE